MPKLQSPQTVDLLYCMEVTRLALSLSDFLYVRNQTWPLCRYRKIINAGMVWRGQICTTWTYFPKTAPPVVFLKIFFYPFYITAIWQHKILLDLVKNIMSHILFVCSHIYCLGYHLHYSSYKQLFYSLEVMCYKMLLLAKKPSKSNILHLKKK